MAERFAELGCTLVLWDVDKNGLEETAAQAKVFKVPVHTYVCDLSVKEKVYEVADKVMNATMLTVFHSISLHSSMFIQSITKKLYSSGLCFPHQPLQFAYSFSLNVCLIWKYWLHQGRNNCLSISGSAGSARDVNKCKVMNLCFVWNIWYPNWSCCHYVYPPISDEERSWRYWHPCKQCWHCHWQEVPSMSWSAYVKMYWCQCDGSFLGECWLRFGI